MKQRPIVAVASVVFAILACHPPPTLLFESAPAIVSPDEHRRTIEALAPPKRERPLVAIIADNAGTETTDFLVPYGVLSASGLVDVVALAPTPDPVQLMPALRIAPQQTFADFDAHQPTGADYVVVPALHHADAPALIEWVRAQAAGGATIVAICSGALVLAEAGLLEGRAATTHWFDVEALTRAHPTVEHVRDRRYVVDRGVATTTGVTASVPISLALVEAIGGAPHAAELAARLGAGPAWTAEHDSDAFRLDGRSVRVALGNLLAFWSHEEVGVHVEDGVDEIALAFTTDALSRTYRSRAYSVAADTKPMITRHGLALLPDRAAGAARVDWSVGPSDPDGPARALDTSLREIRDRYGEDTARLVALQLEYARGG